MRMASVALKNLVKNFPGPRRSEVRAVRDISLEVSDGEFLVLVGPSGCGKSTTLRLIAGLETLDRGSIFIDGRDVTRVAPKDRDIAMVFQNYALFPHMTVYENMGFGLKLRKHGREEIRRRVSEVAETLGLIECLDRKPQALSGGQRQRVALGRAIVRQPKVFLFDEPLSNLDAKMRLQMRAELIQLHRRLGATMIYVTHDQAEAMTMGDRIAVMKDGEVQQADQPMSIYRRPANRFVAGFLGSPPMNFLSGCLDVDADRLVFQASEDGGAFATSRWPCGGLDRIAGAAKEWLGRKIVMGLRPEDIRVNPAPTDGDPSGRCLAQLNLAETLGAESYLHLTASGQPLVARVMEWRNGDGDNALELDWEDGRIHFFDPDSGRRVEL
jgi:multiple sugar transport system ATP-binding protein